MDSTESKPSRSRSENAESPPPERSDIGAACVKNQASTRTSAEDHQNWAATTPSIPHLCLGARAYDGGYFDVGSFFIYNDDGAKVGQQWQRTRKSGFEEANGTTTSSIGSPAPSREPSALGYVLEDGLRLKAAKDKEGKIVDGGDSKAALRSFQELQRQADLIGQALGCVEPVACGTTNGKAAVEGAAPAGDQKENESCLALSNTESNESVQGLVSNGEYMWLGVFSLPPVPRGDDDDTVDLWPSRVARFSEDGVTGILPLAGRHDAKGALVAPQGEGSESETVAGACRAYRLIAQALQDLRPYLPEPSEPPAAPPRTPSRSPLVSGTGPPNGAGPSGAGTTAANGRTGRTLSIDTSEDDSYVAGKRSAAAVTRPASRKAASQGKRRAGRKRRRRECSSDQRQSQLEDEGEGEGEEDCDALDQAENQNQAGGQDHAEDRKAVGTDANGREEDEGRGDGSSVGADEMTVAAVRSSLLRNAADDRAGPELEEWEDTVRKFILHVESLPSGTMKEELSLMFAAALDPTLVRMRAANTWLIDLAEACASREVGVEDEDEEEEEDDTGNTGEGNKPGRAEGEASGRQNALRFKVRLELDATDGDEPPPEGIAGLLRAVAAARAAVENAAKAEACVAAAGDTLGGLQELRCDYKRSLLPGPREPIQLIIAEEQARVLGYYSAHEVVVREQVEHLRAAGSQVAEAYRAVEVEPGWAAVKGQVDNFLRKFERYCTRRLPSEGSSPDLLGLRLAGNHV